MDKQEITERIRQYRQEIDAAKAQWNQEYAAKPELLDNSELQQMRYMLEEQVGRNEARIRALGTGLSTPPTTIVDMDWVEKAEYPAT